MSESHQDPPEMFKDEDVRALRDLLVHRGAAGVAAEDKLLLILADTRNQVRRWGLVIDQLHEQVVGLKTEVDGKVGGLGRQVVGLKTEVDRRVGGLGRQVGDLKTRMIKSERAFREEVKRLRRVFLGGSAAVAVGSAALVVGIQSYCGA